MRYLCFPLLCGLFLVPAGGDLTISPQKKQLKKRLKDNNLRGDWIYDDIDAGFAAAKKSGKPMLVVFRCVP